MKRSGKGGNTAKDGVTNIEQWTIKNTLKKLKSARGNGTSMISLIIPPKKKTSDVNQMLTVEHGTATNIKSRVNRLSVLAAITSAQQALKRYPKIPPNGLCLFVGIVVTEEGKEKKLTQHFEPFKPVSKFIYMCDNRFHTDELDKLLEDDSVFGFIIMDGNGCLYGTLSGSHRRVLQKFDVELPKKHGRGGQSAVRFARLRKEARHNYVRKCAEYAVHNFIQQDKVNVEKIVLAGSAAFKTELFNSDLFDGRLKDKVIKPLLDVSYGGENGFNQAIKLSQESLSNLKFVAEKKLLTNYFTEISRDSGLYCFGVRDVIAALEQSAVSIIIAWEELQYERITMKDPSTSDTEVKFLTKEQLTDDNNFKTKDGQNLDVVDRCDLVEWLAQHFKDYGAKLELVTDKTQEGTQFVRGFGGIGAMLRYKIEFHQEEWEASDDDAWI